VYLGSIGIFYCPKCEVALPESRKAKQEMVNYFKKKGKVKV